MKNADMPAMPCDEFSFINDTGYRETIRGHEGMTKREMMAMHIMASIATTVGYKNYGQMAEDAVAATEELLSELDRASK